MAAKSELPVKVYVQVIASFSESGLCVPSAIVWENGRTFMIDKVTDIRQAASMRAGGQGDRYTVWINGQQKYLYFERSTNLSGPVVGRWFVERRTA